MAQNPRFGPRLKKLQQTLSTKHLSGNFEAVDAVVAVILREEPDDLSLLLIHRAVRSTDPWSGQIGLPGGRMERSDSSPKAALKREVMEEIGVDLDYISNELGTLSISSPMRSLDLKVQPRIYGLTLNLDVRAGTEVQEAFWTSVSKLPSLRTSTEIEIRGTRRVVDAFLVDRHIVWGFTHRVLNELLSIL